jgi:hypothetical protein
MKKIYTDEIGFLKKGTILHYIMYNDRKNGDESKFFDAIVEFDRIETTSNNEKYAICNLLHLIESQIDYNSKYVNFSVDLENDEEVCYLGQKEDYPEYFV